MPEAASADIENSLTEALSRDVCSLRSGSYSRSHRKPHRRRRLPAGTGISSPRMKTACSTLSLALPV